MSLLRTLRFIAHHPLNRGRRARALLRFAWWQVSGRLSGRPAVVEWVNGTRFRVRPGETGLTGNIYVGLQEYEEMAFILQALRPGDLFIDVGANSGAYTILACGAVGCDAYAFEPVPETFARLTENVRLNAIDGRVRCTGRAVGSTAGTLTMTSRRDTSNHILGDDESATMSVPVEVCTLDEILTNEEPFALKLDVEGYELPALVGARAVLGRSSLRAVIIELNGSGRRYGHDEARTAELLMEHGFRPFIYKPSSRALLPLERVERSEGNVLFLRDLEEIRRRLDTAPAVHIGGRIILSEAEFPVRTGNPVNAIASA